MRVEPLCGSAGRPSSTPHRQLPLAPFVLPRVYKFIFGCAGLRGCFGVSLVAASAGDSSRAARGSPSVASLAVAHGFWVRASAVAARARRLWPSGFLVPGHVRPSQTRSQASHVPRVAKRVQSAEPAGGRLLQSAPPSSLLSWTDCEASRCPGFLAEGGLQTGSQGFPEPLPSRIAGAPHTVPRKGWVRALSPLIRPQLSLSRALRLALRGRGGEPMK